ncbi:hypothetical protein EGT44_35105 [Burkholderia cenocepacia]|nr:hypothetical protein EGT44_35105 [Burkholderia cenocepacia]
MAGRGEVAAYWAALQSCEQGHRPTLDRRPRTTEITMNKLLPMTIALLAGSGLARCRSMRPA